MKTASTLAGVFVLALLAAGVYWVRSGSAPAGTAGSGGRDEALQDVTMSERRVDDGGVTVRLALSPTPPVAFAKTRVRVRAESAGAARVLDGATVQFDMAMPMGEHRYTLRTGPDGWMEAEATLPQCVTGERRWYITVLGVAEGRERRARFQFDLAPLSSVRRPGP